MLKRKRDLPQKVVCIALLFVVPLLISAPAVKRGDLPLELDALTARIPWQEARPTGMDDLETADFNPLINRYYPWYVFLNDTRTRGELPLWNPYEGFGAPFFALWRTRALSPFSLPLYVFQLHAAIGISIFMKLLLAGLCAYYAARRFQFSPPYALLAALSFQMSGLLLVGHWHPASDIVPWLPLLLPCMQWMLLGDRIVWPYLALLFGVMTLGGDPETLVGILFFVVVLAVIYSLRTYTYRHLTGTLATLVLSTGLGLALAAVQLAPFLEFTRYGTLEDPAHTFFQIRDLGMLLAPASSSIRINAALWLPGGMVGFLLLPLWLAVRPFANRIRKRRLESLLLTTLSLFVFSIACAPLLRRIPGLSLIDVFHFSSPFPLAMGFLASTAADEWIHLDAEKCRAALKKLAVYLPLAWCAAFLATFIALRGNELSGASGSGLLVSVLVALALITLIIITSFLPKEKLIVYALVFITALFSWWTYAPYRSITPQELIFPETEFVHSLREQDSRVAGSDQLRDWPLAAHQIAQIYSPSGVSLSRTERFIRQLDEKPELFRLTGAQALILTRQDVKGEFSSLRPVLNLQEVFHSGAILMKDLQTHARARVVHSGRMYDPEQRQPLRASGPPLLEGGALPASLTETVTAEANITHNSANKVMVNVSSNRPGVLVLADAWYPGWQVMIDNAAGTTFPVDIAFRGIEVGDGTHEIAFYYQPASLKMGAYISLLALVIVLLGLAARLRARLRG